MRWIPGPVEQTATAAPVRRQRGVAVLAAILSAARWGSATVMSEGVLEHMPPRTLLAVQLTASISVLRLAVLVLRSCVRFDCATRRASLSGLLEPGLACALGVIGLALTTASSAALIGAAEPLFILLLAWLIPKARIGALTLLLAAIATLGLVLVVAPDATGLTRHDSLVGDTLILAGNFFAAIYVIATRRLLSTIEPLPLSALQHSVGLAWTLGVLQYALAFWLYLFALQSLPANLAGFYLTLIPVFGIAAAFIFLGEALSGSQWIGAVLIIASVGAVSRPRRE